MSIAGGQKNHSKPSYLAGLPLGKMTMSVAGGQATKHTNMCYSVDTMNLISCYTQTQKSGEEKFSCICNEHISIKNEMFFIHKCPDALVNCSVGVVVSYKPSNHNITIINLSLQKRIHLSNISNLHGGMYSANNNGNLLWDVLKNKLALIGQEPYDCQSSPGDCFFASLGHALYKNPDSHFQIRCAGIAHLMNHPELYIESLADKSWKNYIQEMSQSGTWCDNIIMQAVANALSCTIHITDSSTNPNATIINPIRSPTSVTAK